MDKPGILTYFEYKHLPQRLQGISGSFYNAAHHMVETLPDNEERAHCLRKLLEAKDCAVRSAVSGK